MSQNFAEQDPSSAPILPPTSAAIDFSGQNLRGRNFKGRNLTGANFSNADIRGANFSKAILRGANFSHARAGLQHYWLIVYAILSFLLALASGILSYFISALLQTLLFLLNNSPLEIAVFIGLNVLLTIALLSLIAIRQNLGAGLRFALLAALALATAEISIALETEFWGLGMVLVIFLFDSTLVVTSFFAILTALLAANLGAIVQSRLSAMTTILGAGIGVYFAGTILLSLRESTPGLLASFILRVYWGTESQQKGIVFVYSIAIALILASFGVYLVWRDRGKRKLSLPNLWGSTSFYKADLTDVDFSAAHLTFANLIKANLTRTCFHNTSGIHTIRVKQSYLDCSQVRQLLVTGKGSGQTFKRANLRGVNLAGANLADASFIETDLCEANLANADISRVKLIQTKLDSANLTGAILTGAYLEDCSLNTETKIDRVRCEYFFKRVPTPENPNPQREPENWTEMLVEGEWVDRLPVVHKVPESLAVRASQKWQVLKTLKKILRSGLSLSKSFVLLLILFLGILAPFANRITALAYSFKSSVILLVPNLTDEAIEASRRAIELDPKSGSAYYFLGITLSQGGKVDEAIAAYRQAIRLNPNRGEIYVNLGNLLVDSGKQEEAIGVWHKAIEVGASDPAASAYSNLGNLFARQNKINEAIAAYRKAIELEPDLLDRRSTKDKLKEVQRLLALQKNPRLSFLPEKLPTLQQDSFILQKRSVVKIIVRNSTSWGDGTGWVVKREGNKAWIVTNRHVVTQDNQQLEPEIEVELYSEPSPGQFRKRRPARIVKITGANESLDLAVLEVTDIPKDIKALPLSTTTLVPNTPIHLIGHPNTKEDWTLSEGKVIQKTELELRTSAFSASGSSGSPVLDGKGRVVGLIWGSRSDSGQFTYSIAFPIAPVRDRLHRWRIL